MINKIRTDILRVKGTRHYDAKLALERGELAINAKILLKPDPQNPYDKNAVEVRTCERKKLGHISRDIAAKYQRLCFEDEIHQIHIHSATKSNDHALFDIRIAVTYTWTSDAKRISLPSTPGVYKISLQRGPVYIGSSENLKRRCREHVNRLISTSHFNNALQKDFNDVGLARFTFEVIKHTKNRLEAENYERLQIIKRLKNGDKLYNKTIDGKGRKSPNYDSQNTISSYQNKNLSDISVLDSERDQFNKSKSTAEIKSPHDKGFVKGENSEFGMYAPPNGNVYEGKYLDGKRSGKGKLTWVSGNVYEGDYLNGVRTGKGKFTYADGTIYEGDFLDGKHHGKGKYTDKDGTIYEGDITMILSQR